jgi:excisionase family DNA binding protein
MSIIPASYVPYQEAAELLGLAPESVRRYIHSDTIQAEEIGRTYYISRKEIERFQRERRPRGRRPEKK